MMWKEQLFNQISLWGFTRKSSGRDEIIFSRTDRDDKIGHALKLEYKATVKSYSIRASGYSVPVQAKLLAKLPVILEYANQANPFLSRYKDPYWNFFDAGRYFGWFYFAIGEKNFDTHWHELSEKFLEPFFFSLETENDVLALLQRTDPPFEWVATHPLFRMAEMIVLAQTIGINYDAIYSNVMPNKLAISMRDFLPGLYLEEIFEKLWERLA